MEQGSGTGSRPTLCGKNAADRLLQLAAVATHSPRRARRFGGQLGGSVPGHIDPLVGVLVLRGLGRCEDGGGRGGGLFAAAAGKVGMVPRGGQRLDSGRVEWHGGQPAHGVHEAVGPEAGVLHYFVVVAAGVLVSGGHRRLKLMT